MFTDLKNTCMHASSTKKSDWTTGKKIRHILNDVPSWCYHHDDVNWSPLTSVCSSMRVISLFSTLNFDWERCILILDIFIRRCIWDPNRRRRMTISLHLHEGEITTAQSIPWDDSPLSGECTNILCDNWSQTQKVRCLNFNLRNDNHNLQKQVLTITSS